jgi:PAS domain S-box-containing protein
MEREEDIDTGIEEADPDDRAIDSKGFLQSVIDGIQDSITIVDRDYNILFANKTARSRVHPSTNREKIVGQTCFRTFHAHDSPCQHCLTPVTFEKGKKGTTTYTKTGPDGQEQFLELHTYPIKGADGRVERVIEINRDITERKHLEMQLIQASKMAALGELAGGLAHQLNNPLVGVQNFVQLLLARMDDKDPNRNLAETIERAGSECVKIIRNLLKFSRESHLDFTSVEINHVIDDVLSLLEKQIHLEGVKIEKTLADDIPPFQGNETQLAQVIMNIIQNGAQAIEGSGIIHIHSRVSGDGNEVVIEISDTGSGIPKVHRDRIFEPFFTSKEEGTGLGLSVAYGIVKNHHGTIHVESEEEKGTTFTLRFPLSAETGNRQEDHNE